MPIHLFSLTEKCDDGSIPAELPKGALDHADAAVVSEDRCCIQMARSPVDELSGQRIGKLVYDLE